MDSAAGGAHKTPGPGPKGGSVGPAGAANDANVVRSAGRAALQQLYNTTLPPESA